MKTHGTSINDQGDMSDGRYQNITWAYFFLQNLYHLELCYYVSCTFIYIKVSFDTKARIKNQIIIEWIFPTTELYIHK